MSESVLNNPHGLLYLNAAGVDVRVQFCLSPLCSTIASLLEACSTSWWPAPTDGWRHVLAQTGEIPELADLRCYTAYPVLPRFLASRLTEPAPRFRDQIDEIAATTPDEVQADLAETFGDAVPDHYEEFTRNPTRALTRITAALRTYHDRVVAPRWPAIRPVLEREIVRQAYTMATRGSHSALNDVHPFIAVADDMLRVGPPGTEGQCGTVADRLIMLTPLVCGREGVIADVTGPGPIKIGYAAPAARMVWAKTAANAVSAEFDQLLGTARAAIVRLLTGPSTTTDLAAELNLAPATVSEHLAQLRRSGLVESTRSGRYVYYGRTTTAERLLSLYETHSSLA